MCCRQVSNRVSEYTRHAEKHRNQTGVSSTKVTYMNTMCTDLRNRTRKELEIAESKHVSQVDMLMSTSKKRARNVMDDDQTVSGAPGSKLHKVDIIDSLSFQHSNGIDPLNMPPLNAFTELTSRCTSSALHAGCYGNYGPLSCCRICRYGWLFEYSSRGGLRKLYGQIRCPYKQHDELSWSMDGMGWDTVLEINMYAYSHQVVSPNAKFIRIFRSSK